MALPPHTLLPPPVSGCLPHIPPEAIMGNDAKRGHEWARQITEIIGNEQLEAHFHDGAESTTGHS